MPEVDAIRAQLFALQDKEYQVFNSRLMPTATGSGDRGAGAAAAQAGKAAGRYPGSGGVSAMPAAFLL